MTKVLRKRDWLYIPRGYDYAALYCSDEFSIYLVYSLVPFTKEEIYSYFDLGETPKESFMGDIGENDGSGWTYDKVFYEDTCDVFDSDSWYCCTECFRRPAGLPMNGIFIEEVDENHQDLVFQSFCALKCINIPDDDSYTPDGDYDPNEFDSCIVRIVHDKFVMYNYSNLFPEEDQMTVSELMLLVAKALDSKTDSQFILK